MLMVFLALCLVMLLTVAPSESAPAPFAVDALVQTNLLGLAAGKGNILFY